MPKHYRLRKGETRQSNHARYGRKIVDLKVDSNGHYTETGDYTIQLRDAKGKFQTAVHRHGGINSAKYLEQKNARAARQARRHAAGSYLASAKTPQELVAEAKAHGPYHVSDFRIRNKPKKVYNPHPKGGFEFSMDMAHPPSKSGGILKKNAKKATYGF